MEVSPARTYGGCMTSNFALQLSGSIWVTYGTFEILGWLEAWYLKNGLHIIGFISIAYYINFEAIAGRCGVAGGVNFGCFGISAPTCSCDKFCLIHLLHGAHPIVHALLLVKPCIWPPDDVFSPKIVHVLLLVKPCIWPPRTTVSTVGNLENYRLN